MRKLSVKCVNSELGEYEIENADINLKDTFECGQCFRWNFLDGVWQGVAFGHAVYMRQTENGIAVGNTTEEDIYKVWIPYLDLEHDYKPVRDFCENNAFLTAAAESGKGIRILKQAPKETIFSFIISSNNNISRIKKIVEAFCALFGEEIWVGNRLFYAFPKAEALKNATVEDLEPIHAGFRDKYLIDCARVLNENEDFIPSLSSLDADEARKKLKTIKGIGDKVADCILLFAFQKYDVFPKDVWINRVTREVFHENFSEKELGENAGIIQQYMFYFGRSNPDFLKFGTFDEQPRVFALDERPDLIKETAEALYDEFARESESAAFFERMVESSAKAKTALPKTFILTVKGRFAGTCGLWRSDLMTRQDLCPWLALLYVKPEYRKRHFGALLQKAVVEYAEKLGYEKVYLYTDLKKYYDKTGWKPFGKDLECDGTEKSLYEVETKDYGNEDK